VKPKQKDRVWVPLFATDDTTLTLLSLSLFFFFFFILLKLLFFLNIFWIPQVLVNFEISPSSKFYINLVIHLSK